MIHKKSVVLADINGGKEKAVVLLENDGSETIGNVRLYNFEKEPQGILSLGFLCDKQVIKAGLIHEGTDFYTFKISPNKNLNTFSCALVNLHNGQAKPLLIGSTNGTKNVEENLCASLSIFDQEPTVENIKNILDQNGVFLEDQEEIDQLAEQQVQGIMQENRCSDCKYRDAFFKLEDDFTPKQEEQEPTFFSGVKEQIETLFSKYEPDDILAEIVPDSKWVKIDSGDDGNHYVVGLLYEDDKIKYICYGVPSIHTDPPPVEFEGLCQWLPIDTAKPDGFGYWITYQDANTGENVKMDYQTM